MDDTRKIILRALRGSEGKIAKARMERVVSKYYFGKNYLPDNHFEKIENCLRLLILDGDIIDDGIFYCLTPKGYEFSDIWHKRFWRFLIWEKHNLFSLLTFIISLVSLVLSVVALWVNFKR